MGRGEGEHFPLLCPWWLFTNKSACSSHIYSNSLNSELGNGFFNLSMESDPPAVRKCAEAYRGVMGGIDEGVRKVPDERIVAEVVGSINNRVAEMDQIKKKIDERVNHKREYDYYVQKVRELKEKPSTDATKLPRSESKLSQNTTLLEQSTVELMNIFDLYERARPTLLKAEFEVLRSCQKQYFTGAASAMNMFVIVPEGKPGGGLSIEQIAAASGVAATPQSFTASRTGGTSVPTMDSSHYSSSGPSSSVAPPPSAGGAIETHCLQGKDAVCFQRILRR